MCENCCSIILHPSHFMIKSPVISSSAPHAHPSAKGWICGDPSCTSVGKQILTRGRCSRAESLHCDAYGKARKELKDSTWCSLAFETDETILQVRPAATRAHCEIAFLQAIDLLLQALLYKLQAATQYTHMIFSSTHCSAFNAIIAGNNFHAVVNIISPHADPSCRSK